jgi:hypothetical protein
MTSDYKRTTPTNRLRKLTGDKSARGHPIGWDDEGNLVEWMPDEENPEWSWPRILRRADDQIASAYQEYRDKVSWKLHQSCNHRDKSGRQLSCAERQHVDAACVAALRAEEAYGRESLVCDDFDHALRCGRLSALAWALGFEWQRSLDL